MGAMVRVMDENLGRLLDRLDEDGLAENTIVVFYSDNGGNMYDHLGGLPVTSNAPLRGGKAMSSEGGVRVPLIVRWPGVTDAGRVTPALATSVDFLPTFVEGLGLEAPPIALEDGVSLMPALHDEAFDRGPIFNHFPHYIGNSQVDGLLNRPGTTVRDGDWKLHRYYADGPGQADRFELYDLASDIGETNDLSAGHPDRVESLAALIDEHLEATGALRPTANPNFGNTPAPVGETAGWEVSPNGQATLAMDDGQLVMVSTGDDPYMTTTSLPADASGELVLRLKLSSTASGFGQVLWTEAGSPALQRPRPVGSLPGGP